MVGETSHLTILVGDFGRMQFVAAEHLHTTRNVQVACVVINAQCILRLNQELNVRKLVGVIQLARQEVRQIIRDGRLVIIYVPDRRGGLVLPVEIIICKDDGIVVGSSVNGSVSNQH